MCVTSTVYVYWRARCDFGGVELCSDFAKDAATRPEIRKHRMQVCMWQVLVRRLLANDLLNKYTKLRMSKLSLNQFTLTVNYTWIENLINLWQKFESDVKIAIYTLTPSLFHSSLFAGLAEGHDEMLGLCDWIALINWRILVIETNGWAEFEIDSFYPDKRKQCLTYNVYATQNIAWSLCASWGIKNFCKRNTYAPTFVRSL